MTEQIVKSDCGAANLLAAVFNADRRQVQEHLGLRPVRPVWHCPVCDTPIPPPSRPSQHQRVFCSEECKHRWYWPLVECEECHTPFEIRRSRLLIQIRRYKRLNCSHECAGAYVGRTYGFVAHPECHSEKAAGKSSR